MEVPSEYLAATPYLTHSDAASVKRFATVISRSANVRSRAQATYARVGAEAKEILAPFGEILRTALVAESNKIEGYDWEARQVRELVATSRELLDQPLATFVSAIRGDPRTYEALGLYKAHSLADEWARNGVDRPRPREFEIRQLHSLITGGEAYAGRYKVADNEIGGAAHTTTPHFDVPRAMGELADWWEKGTGDPALDATVIHAWLTHIHPFEDGNGRMARLLANMALAQAGYPPLIVNAQTDRGQYYDALAASDEGDILPLYDLFVAVLGRTARVMESPNYVRDLIDDRVLVDSRGRWSLWCKMVTTFHQEFASQLGVRRWSADLQGMPSLESYNLLAKRNSEGNGWYSKVFGPAGRPEWLMWFGYRSNELLSISDDRGRSFPSIFVSIRDESPEAVHPFRPFRGSGSNVPDEVVLRPGEARPVLLRWDYSSEEHSLREGAVILVDALTTV